jgi:hypothetical protein
MKVWITKYALSSGIFESEAEVCGLICRGMIKLTRREGYPEYFHGEGKEWHTTSEGAKKKAEEMRIRKVNILLKQIKRIQDIKF